MSTQLTDRTVRQLVVYVSDQYYTMTGSVTAVIAAHAAALAEACMQISLDNQVDKLSWQDVTTRIGQMAHIKDTLLEWSNQDVNDIPAEQLQNSDESLQQVLDYFVEVSRLTLQAATMLQDFHPMVIDQVHNDLVVSVQLLSGTVQASISSLDHHLSQWPDRPLVKEYAQTRDELQAGLVQLKSSISSNEVVPPRASN